MVVAAVFDAARGLDMHSTTNPLTVILVGFSGAKGPAVWPACTETCVKDTILGSVNPLLLATSLGKFGFAAPTVIRAPIVADIMKPECELAGSWFRQAKALVEQLAAGESVGVSADGRPVTATHFPGPTLYLFPQEAGAGMCQVGGFSNVGCTPSACSSWLRGFGHGLVVHELGHLMGFSHAALDVNGDGLVTGAEESADLSDPMTSDGTVRGFAAPHRLQAGWLTCTNPSTSPGPGSGVGPKVALRTVSGPATTTPPDVFCYPGPNGTVYMVSYRTQSGQDAALAPPWAGAVYLHRFNPATNTSVCVKAMTPGDGVIVDGMTLSVAATNATVAAISFQPCVRGKVTVAVSGSHTSAAGTLVSVKATNGDLRCPARTNVTVMSFSPIAAYHTVALGITVTKDNSPAEMSVVVTHSLTGAVLLRAPTFVGDNGGTSPTMTLGLTYQDLSLHAALVVDFLDSGGDGYCCDWGPGSYTVTANGVLIEKGGRFGSKATVVVPIGARWLFPKLLAGQTQTASTMLPAVSGFTATSPAPTLLVA